MGINVLFLQIRGLEKNKLTAIYSQNNLFCKSLATFFEFPVIRIKKKSALYFPDLSVAPCYYIITNKEVDLIQFELYTMYSIQQIIS